MAYQSIEIKHNCKETKVITATFCSWRGKYIIAKLYEGDNLQYDKSKLKRGILHAYYTICLLFIYSAASKSHKKPRPIESNPSLSTSGSNRYT